MICWVATGMNWQKKHARLWHSQQLDGDGVDHTCLLHFVNSTVDCRKLLISKDSKSVTCLAIHVYDGKTWF